MFNPTDFIAVTDETLVTIVSKLEESKNKFGFLYPSDEKLMNYAQNEIDRRKGINNSVDLFQQLGMILNPKTI